MYQIIRASTRAILTRTTVERHLNQERIEQAMWGRVVESRYGETWHGQHMVHHGDPTDSSNHRITAAHTSRRNTQLPPSSPSFYPRARTVATSYPSWGTKRLKQIGPLEGRVWVRCGFLPSQSLPTESIET